MSNPVHLFVQLTCQADHETEVIDTLKWEAAESRKEAGNTSFLVTKDNKVEHVYHLYEVWNDQAALDAHLETAHFKKIWELIEAKKVSADSMNECTVVE